ncbi:hypothetical protein C8Q73DRAFT_321044 [Cubamyces lactineus]|nr:hypothetical protein C8Q73DRAFT_321044 [Cubamyces lactineus]
MPLRSATSAGGLHIARAILAGCATSVAIAVIVAYRIYQTLQEPPPPHPPRNAGKPLNTGLKQGEGRVNDGQAREKSDNIRVGRTHDEKDGAAPAPCPTSRAEATPLSAPTPAKARQQPPPQTINTYTQSSNASSTISEEQRGNAYAGYSAVFVPDLVLKEARAWADPPSPADTYTTYETTRTLKTIPIYVPQANASRSSPSVQASGAKTASGSPTPCSVRRHRPTPTPHANLESTAPLSSPVVVPVHAQSPAAPPQLEGRTDGKSNQAESTLQFPTHHEEGTCVTIPAGVHVESSNVVGPARSTVEQQSSTNHDDAPCDMQLPDRQSDGPTPVAESKSEDLHHSQIDLQLARSGLFMLGSDIGSAMSMISDLPEDNYPSLNSVVDGIVGNSIDTRIQSNIDISDSRTGLERAEGGVFIPPSLESSPRVLPSDNHVRKDIERAPCSPVENLRLPAARTMSPDSDPHPPTPITCIPTVNIDLKTELDTNAGSSFPQNGTLSAHSASDATRRGVNTSDGDLHDLNLDYSSTDPDHVGILSPLISMPESFPGSLSPIEERDESEVPLSPQKLSSQLLTSITTSLSLPSTFTTSDAPETTTQSQSSSTQDGAATPGDHAARALHIRTSDEIEYWLPPASTARFLQFRFPTGPPGSGSDGNADDSESSSDDGFSTPVFGTPLGSPMPGGWSPVSAPSTAAMSWSELSSWDGSTIDSEYFSPMSPSDDDVLQSTASRERM